MGQVERGQWMRARSQWHVTANEAEVLRPLRKRQRFDTRQDTPPSAFRV
jgi:hypothetical protein